MAQKQAKSGKYIPSTVGSFEKQSGLKLHSANSKMHLATYMKRSGMPGIAKAIRTVEKELAKTK